MGTLLAFNFDPSRLSTGEYLQLLAPLLMCLVMYMVYKIVWHPDYGVPVQRRLICRGLHVERDQIAFVPFWWSNLQVQRAVGRHWKNVLRQTFVGPAHQS